MQTATKAIYANRILTPDRGNDENRCSGGSHKGSFLLLRRQLFIAALSTQPIHVPAERKAEDAVFGLFVRLLAHDPGPNRGKLLDPDPEQFCKKKVAKLMNEDEYTYTKTTKLYCPILPRGLEPFALSAPSKSA